MALSFLQKSALFAAFAVFATPQLAFAQATPVARPSWKPAPKPPPPPKLPDAPARLWLIAPGPNQLWTLRIDNEGDKAIRIPADARLLSFEVEVPVIDPKNPKKKPIKYKCELPDSMRPKDFPEQRALLLAPGQSYIESFDPRLFCFGKNAGALVGTAKIRTTFGWAPPPKWSLAARKPPAPPFAAEGTDNPATTTPLRNLTAPTIVLSFGLPPTPLPPVPAAADAQAKESKEPAPSASDQAKPGPSAEGQNTASTDVQNTASNGTPAQPAKPASAGAGDTQQPASTKPDAKAAEPAAIVDANAPRLGVSGPAYTDASSARHVAVKITVKNAGGRPMLAALKARMLAFDITGPDRTVSCPASPPTNALPRESFRTYKPGGDTSFSVLLREVCPENPFSRPGLYLVSATVIANEPGTELEINAYTGKSTTEKPILLRLQTGREPFHKSPPVAVPTPKPKIDDET